MPGIALLNTNVVSPVDLNNRYAFTQKVSTINNLTVYDVYHKIEIPISSDDIYHVVTQTQDGRLDIIAQMYYNDASLWWMIAVANNMVDPFIVPAGVTLRVPSLNSYYLSVI